MRVDDFLRKCVVFVGYVNDDRFTAVGTAFMIMADTLGQPFSHVVTARHNIEEIGKTYENKGIPADERRVWLRVNTKDGAAEFVDTLCTDWHVKDIEEGYLDVAVLLTHGVNVDRATLDVSNIQSDMFATEEAAASIDLMAGAPVVTVGLFSTHWGATHNLPIVRNGHVALMRDPANPVETKRGFMDAHLVELRSIGGLSGSPVFVPTEPAWVANRQIKSAKGITKAFLLLGLVHGNVVLRNAHNDLVDPFASESPSSEKLEDVLSSDELHSGIAVVVPTDKIMEVVNCDALKARREAISKTFTASNAEDEPIQSND